MASKIWVLSREYRGGTFTGEKSIEHLIFFFENEADQFFNLFKKIWIQLTAGPDDSFL